MARYTRSTNQYDALVVQPRGAALADVTNFKQQHPAHDPEGVQPGPGHHLPDYAAGLDRGRRPPTTRPAATRSTPATTTATNAWETLSFNFVNAPSATANTSLNEIVLLVAPNTTARRKMYLDDFYGPSLVGFVPTATRTVQTAAAAFAPAYPNPTSGLTQLPFSLQKPAMVSLAVFDNLGRRVAEVIAGEPRTAGSVHRRAERRQAGPRPLHLPPYRRRREPDRR